MKINQSVNFPILTYHSIDESGSVISTAPEIFRQQMKSLSDAGYKVITIRELTAGLQKNQPIPDKTVALTFDDGFQNFYTTAFPILEQYGFQATVFLVTDFCGQNNDWEGNPPNFPTSKILSWNEIKELSELGIEFGNHTRRHPDLTKIPIAKAENEIVESKAVIEDSLGHKVTTFAYPFGKFDSTIRELVEKTHRAACSTKLGKVRSGSDFLALERVDAYYLSNIRIFNRLSTKVFDNYLQLRHGLRVVKAVISPN